MFQYGITETALKELELYWPFLLGTDFTFRLEFLVGCCSQTRGRYSAEDGASERGGCSQSRLRKTGRSNVRGWTNYH